MVPHDVDTHSISLDTLLAIYNSQLPETSLRLAEINWQMRIPLAVDKNKN